ncbi:MAG TPA: response regulator transcription factor, partial [Pyrinomonadaceae bacterium]|nr:response regulator transcription factor [Pyrinomonadaceae bacterium]
MENKLQVLIAEDHATVREGIKLLVGAQPDMEIIGEANNGDVAIAEALRLKPDIVLMDISMPGLNGLLATKKLRRLLPSLKILILTRHSDDGYLQQMI